MIQNAKTSNWRVSILSDETTGTFQAERIVQGKLRTR
jgi:hypothetical protein